MHNTRAQRSLAVVASVAFCALIASFSVFAPRGTKGGTASSNEHVAEAPTIGAGRDGENPPKQATAALPRPATAPPTTGEVPGTVPATPSEPSAQRGEPSPTTPATESPIATKIGDWRGAYVPHGWIAAPKSDDFVRSAVRDLESSGFNRQIHNVGFLDETGRLSPQTYSGLDHWIRVSRSEDPTQQIVLWISGDEDMHVNNHVSHDQIAAFLSELMSTSGADGLLLDLEPFGRDNVNLLQLLEAVRVRLPSTWLGITAPATEGTWSAGFVSSLANTVDALSPMLYDTSLKNADAYQAFVTAAVASFSTATASKAALIPSLPAYAANRWHDPSVESIANASVSLNAASAPEIHGAAVYWWWEMDAAAKADWLAAISG